MNIYPLICTEVLNIFYYLGNDLIDSIINIDSKGSTTESPIPESHEPYSPTGSDGSVEDFDLGSDAGSDFGDGDFLDSLNGSPAASEAGGIEDSFQDTGSVNSGGGGSQGGGSSDGGFSSGSENDEDRCTGDCTHSNTNYNSGSDTQYRNCNCCGDVGATNTCNDCGSNFHDSCLESNHR
jgi:hypothetical protein